VVILALACMPVPGVNVLPRPLAGVIFHYSSTLDYRPEFTAIIPAQEGRGKCAQVTSSLIVSTFLLTQWKSSISPPSSPR
jgi:hypothetical protein